ncbi:MAG: PucR family transcriptional regulator ligand-binding domain-containing protein [Hespellia sp.]|nr:PucR family transcriptional regulator ligand-binding domain-containing protein [Hespellia sp.]
MAVLLRELMNQVKHIEMKLVAGEKGLDRVVHWTHMVDSTCISDFLDGGEVAFTTGIGLGNGQTLAELVKGVYENRAAAIVINIGPYIKEITPDIIAFADAHDFPVFEAPWEVHMAEIMRIFCFSITQSEQASFKRNAAFENAIFFPRQEELYLGPLLQKGYSADGNYCVAIMDFTVDGQGLKEERMDAIQMFLDAKMSHFFSNIPVVPINGQLVLVFCDHTQEDMEAAASEILSETRQLIRQGEQVTLGVGKSVVGIRKLNESYHQAQKISSIQRRESGDHMTQEQRHPLLFYWEMGIYKLLMSIEDQEVIWDFYQETVGPLYEYDRMNQSNLVQVLQSYVAHSGSVKDTAQELFVHRNTINYKIKKIEDVLDRDLSNLSVRTELNIGFMLYQLLGHL